MSAQDEATMVLEVAQGFAPGATRVSEAWWSEPDLVAYHVYGPDGDWVGNLEWFTPGVPTWTPTEDPDAQF